MIYPLSGLLIGAAIGAWRAKANGGKPLDMLQWGAAFGIALGAGRVVRADLRRTQPAVT